MTGTDLTTSPAGGKAPLLPWAVESALENNVWGDWSSADALARLRRAGCDAPLRHLADRLLESNRPCDPETLRHRLGLLGMSMAPSRPPAEATAWLHETARLLGDIPEDILFAALDEHQRTNRFLPTVAEVRALAEPHAEKRRKQAARLDAMARYLASGQHVPQLAPPKREVMDRRGEPMSEAECAELNAILAKAGALTRYRPDGTRYEAESETGKERRPGPARKPTRADYIEMGVDPAVLDAMDANKASENNTVGAQ